MTHGKIFRELAEPTANETELTADYEVTTFTGATRKQSELAAAFDRVAPKPNWKMAIDAVIDQPVDEALITDAVVHFTGAVPKFHRFGKHAGAERKVRVKAAGYYATIGA